MREMFVAVAVLATSVIAACQQTFINPATGSVTYALAPTPSNEPPVMGSPSPFPSPPLIVSPPELDNQMQVFSAVYNASSLVRYYCNKSNYLVRLHDCIHVTTTSTTVVQIPAVACFVWTHFINRLVVLLYLEMALCLIKTNLMFAMQTEYFGLNIINCDFSKTQAAHSGTPPKTCPAGCAAGVVKVGATCSAAYELAYTQLMAFQHGLSFNLTNVNPFGISSLCQIPYSQQELTAFYNAGLVQHYYNQVQKNDPSIPCNETIFLSDATTLSLARCEVALSQSPGTCPSNCTSLISTVGSGCLVTLANQVASSDLKAYTHIFSNLSVCGVSSNSPLAAPVSLPTTNDPSPLPVAPAVPPAPVDEKLPTSGQQHSKSLACVAVILAIGAIMLL